MKEHELSNLERKELIKIRAAQVSALRDYKRYWILKKLDEVFKVGLCFYIFECSTVYTLRDKVRNETFKSNNYKNAKANASYYYYKGDHGAGSKSTRKGKIESLTLRIELIDKLLNIH